MNLKDKEEFLILKKRYKKEFNKYIKVRKNYTHGNKSKPEIIFERRLENGK